MATSHTCCGRWVPNSGPQEEQQSCGPGIGSQPLLTVLVTDTSQPAACNTPLHRGHTLLRAFKPGTQQLTTGPGQAPSQGCPPQFLSFIPVAGRTQWGDQKVPKTKATRKDRALFSRWLWAQATSFSQGLRSWCSVCQQEGSWYPQESLEQALQRALSLGKTHTHLLRCLQ